VLFNVVALVFFVGEFLSDPVAGLPTLPDLLVGLTSVSAIGYLGKKTLSSGAPTITDVQPDKGKPLSSVRVSGTRLVEGNAPPAEVRFGEKVSAPVEVFVEHGIVLQVQVPKDAPAGTVDFVVMTASGKLAKWEKQFEVA